MSLRNPAQIVGVVRNLPTFGFGSENAPYVWIASAGSRPSSILVRHSGGPSALLSALPALARATDRHFLATAEPYVGLIARWRRSADVSAAVAGALGALSLLLACVGMYGVAAYNVTQRTREVGVRVALGARSSAILRMFAVQNLRPVAIGSVAGIAGSIAFGRLLTSLLYGVQPADPPALFATVIVLAAAAALATWGPARRATRVDPAIALREE